MRWKSIQNVNRRKKFIQIMEIGRAVTVLYLKFWFYFWNLSRKRIRLWSTKAHRQKGIHCKYIQCNFYSFKMCPTFHCNLTVRFTFNCCSKYSRIIVNWFTVFKLADRMRSMRTNGASKNQDCPGQNGLIYRLRRNHCYFWYLWYQTVWYVFRYT